MSLRSRIRNIVRPVRAPRPWRPPWLPKGIDVHSEKDVHGHVPEEQAELFLAVDPGTTEIEVLNWLHSTILLTKPQSILETGSHQGFGTLALAAACKANGFGIVHSVEIDPKSCRVAEERLLKAGLSSFATVHQADSLQFLRNTDLTFQFAFFDSVPEIRAEEYKICNERGILHGVASFHDTSPFRTKTLDWCPAPPLHEKFRRDLQEMATGPNTTGFFESRLSRGLFVIFVDRSANPS